MHDFMFSLSLLVHKMHERDLFRLGYPCPDSCDDVFIFNFNSEDRLATFCDLLDENGLTFFRPAYQPV